MVLGGSVRTVNFLSEGALLFTNCVLTFKFDSSRNHDGVFCRNVTFSIFLYGRHDCHYRVVAS